MGANAVANATGILLTTRFSGAWLAGLIEGIGLALDVLTWGRPLLERVAFEVVHMDKNMATAAQGVQALVVLGAVTCGYFTSMNQALVGTMAGTGIARSWRSSLACGPRDPDSMAGWTRCRYGPRLCSGQLASLRTARGLRLDAKPSGICGSLAIT